MGELGAPLGDSGGVPSFALQGKPIILILGWGVLGRSANDNKEAIVKADGRDFLAGGLAGLGGVVGRGEDCCEDMKSLDRLPISS